jgi:hypothetical protein
MATRKAWCPRRLRAYPRIRKVLAVLLPEGQSHPPTPEQYLNLHDQKVIALLKKDPDWRGTLEMYLEPSAWYELKGDEKNLEDVLLSMKEDARWWGSRSLVAQYLRKRLTLEQLKNHLGIDQDDEVTSVSEVGLSKEARTLNLAEFLELAIPPMQ